MVNNRKEHTRKTPAKQGPDAVTPKPMKIGAATPYDFRGSNLTAYGGSVTRGHDAGEVAIPATDRRARDDQTADHVDAWRSGLCWR